MEYAMVVEMVAKTAFDKAEHSVLEKVVSMVGYWVLQSA